MFNYYRMLIIFGVLFAADWMQLSGADPLSDEDKIDYFTMALTSAKLNKLASPSGINHFQSWGSWNFTAPYFRLKCALAYENEMERNGLSITSEVPGLSAVLAYRALDNHITQRVKAMKQWESLRAGIDRIYKAGEYFKFNAFLWKRYESKDLEDRVIWLMNSDEEISEDEALSKIIAEFLDNELQ